MHVRPTVANCSVFFFYLFEKNHLHRSKTRKHCLSLTCLYGRTAIFQQQGFCPMIKLIANAAEYITATLFQILYKKLFQFYNIYISYIQKLMQNTTILLIILICGCVSEGLLFFKANFRIILMFESNLRKIRDLENLKTIYRRIIVLCTKKIFLSISSVNVVITIQWLWMTVV